MKKLTSIMIFLLLALLLITATGVSVIAKDSLRVAVSAGPLTMNPYGSDSGSNFSPMTNIFDCLLLRTLEGKLIPGLATSWERVDDVTWRFNLRKGVKFHNGNEFTWEDVKYSFERMKEPFPVSQLISYGALIESVKKVNNDPWTIDIKTVNPIAYFDQNLHQAWIMDKESTENRSIGEIGANPIGTGPYKFVEWVKGSYLKLTANEDYWDGASSIKNAELVEISEASTRLAAISTGQVDIIQDVPLELYDNLVDDPNVEVITVPSRRVIFLQLRNSTGFPASDMRVREAVYMAINEDEIIEKVMFGHAFPAAQLTDPSTTGYDSSLERLFPYDPEKAKALLAEAGYPDGFKIRLSGPNDRYVRDAQILEAIAQQLAQVGIEVELDVKPKSIFFPEISAHTLDFCMFGWSEGAYDFGRTSKKLVHSVDMEKGFGEMNGVGYSDSTLDRIIDEADEIIDIDKRSEHLKLTNKTIADKIASIPLHYQVQSYAIYKGRGIDFTPHSEAWMLFNTIAIKK